MVEVEQRDSDALRGRRRVDEGRRVNQSTREEVSTIGSEQASCEWMHTRRILGGSVDSEANKAAVGGLPSQRIASNGGVAVGVEDRCVSTAVCRRVEQVRRGTLAEREREVSIPPRLSPSFLGGMPPRKAAAGGRRQQRQKQATLTAC